MSVAPNSTSPGAPLSPRPSRDVILDDEPQREPFTRPKSTPFPSQDIPDGKQLAVRLSTHNLPEASASEDGLAKVSNNTSPPQVEWMHGRTGVTHGRTVSTTLPLSKWSATGHQSEVLCQDEETGSTMPGLTFVTLPAEIHEYVLDHLFGERASIANHATTSGGWSTALRHSRRKQLSDLALINRQYRVMVQGRLFKHIKVQGTRPSINEATHFFNENRHLRKHPKHIEVWSPVWERRAGYDFDQIVPPPATTERTALIQVNTTAGHETSNNVTSAYQLASRNSTLHEIFEFVRTIFLEACVLSLEGGHCKKPPMVKHFSANDEAKKLPILPQIRTLILKSSWNIMRTEEHFDTIMAALPGLSQWHSSYAAAKSKSYLNIARISPRLPATLVHLNLSLETSYSREAVSPKFWRKLYPEKAHICLALAKAMPQLESFIYCGRICDQFFIHLVKYADPDRRGNSRLKHVELTVKNCCRSPSLALDGSGITNAGFIASFAALVTAGVRSLDRLRALSLLRIRFIDLESPMPLLNPFFQLKNDQCTGLWSDTIVSALAVARSSAKFVQVSDDFGGVSYDKAGKLIAGATFPHKKPLSLKVSNYEALYNDFNVLG